MNFWTAWHYRVSKQEEFVCLIFSCHVCLTEQIYFYFIQDSCLHGPHLCHMHVSLYSHTHLSVHHDSVEIWRAEKHQEIQMLGKISRMMSCLMATDCLTEEQNLAFHDHNSTLPNNVNVQGLVKQLTQFDPVMRKHVRQAQKKRLLTTDATTWGVDWWWNASMLRSTSGCLLEAYEEIRIVYLKASQRPALIGAILCSRKITACMILTKKHCLCTALTAA